MHAGVENICWSLAADESDEASVRAHLRAEQVVTEREGGNRVGAYDCDGVAPNIIAQNERRARSVGRARLKRNKSAVVTQHGVIGRNIRQTEQSLSERGGVGA